MEGHITTKIYYEQVCDLYKFVSNSKIKEALEESDESDTEEIDTTESTATISSALASTNLSDSGDDVDDQSESLFHLSQLLTLVRYKSGQGSKS